MPDTPCRVRPAVPADLPAIHTFIRGLAEYERLLDRVAVTENDLREHIFGAHPYCEVLIGEDAKGPAGFALFFHGYSTFDGRPTLWLEDLFVLPDRRRRGIGVALIRRLAEIAVQRRCNRFEWSVLDWNEPAIAFYRSLGASLLKEWTICRVEGEALRVLAARARTPEPTARDLATPRRV